MADKNDKDENDGKDVRHALWCAHEQRMNLTKERAEYYYLLVYTNNVLVTFTSSNYSRCQN